jgi:hypothetical protein
MLLNRLAATAMVDFALAQQKYDNFLGTRLPPFVDEYVRFAIFCSLRTLNPT